MKKYIYFIYIIFISNTLFSQSIKQPKNATFVNCSECQLGNIVISDDAKFNKFSTVKVSSTPYDNLMVGVYNEIDVKIIDLEGTHFRKGNTVITEGVTYVKYNSENGLIKKGDLITSSSTKGTAMKAIKSGIILGIALEDAKKPEGFVKIRVMIQYIIFNN